MVGLTISRILFRRKAKLVIYLGPSLLTTSSGFLYDAPRAGGPYATYPLQQTGFTTAHCHQCGRPFYGHVSS